jgi:hypothetical protein
MTECIAVIASYTGPAATGPVRHFVQCGERPDGGFERQTAFVRGQSHAIAARKRSGAVRL